MNQSLIKNALLVSVIIFSFGCATQQFQPVELTNVVTIPNKDQKAIYNKTRQWFSQYFVSGESVIDYEDKEAGTIIGNGIAKIGSDPFGFVQYNIKYNVRIDTKDGKFRALTKISQHTNTDSKSTYTVYNVSKDRAADAEKHVNKIVTDIKNYVSNSSIGSQADW